MQESIQESHRVNISRNPKNFVTADPSHDEKSEVNLTFSEAQRIEDYPDGSISTDSRQRIQLNSLVKTPVGLLSKNHSKGKMKILNEEASKSS